ncbi:MAG TPA: hypothetical protein VGY56_12875 [Verrucomicrobiae bacterium]|nr:hypothetical protein [Verrucomicrobiae bacterium]
MFPQPGWLHFRTGLMFAVLACVLAGLEGGLATATGKGSSDSDGSRKSPGGIHNACLSPLPSHPDFLFSNVPPASPNV